MATKKLIFIFSLLFSMFVVKAFAYDIAVENANGITIYYNYINDGTELEVTRCSLSGAVVIPEEVTYMDVTRKVTSIGAWAFANCNGLTSVTIPNSVTSIKDGAFSECNGLTSITIPNSVTSIGEQAFTGCRGLTSVHISDLDSWCRISFGFNPLFYANHLFLNGVEIKDLVIPNTVTSIGTAAFQGCSGLTSVTIPNSVTSIGLVAFSECRHITSVTIPNSVTTIGNGAFQLCTSLTSISIPNSVLSIGEWAFSYCNSLTSVMIPNSVTTIGTKAFADCGGLTSVTIPNSVTSFGDEVFYDCYLVDVISMIENPFKISTGTFTSSTYQNAALYVPVGTVDKYKATDGWKEFTVIKEGTPSGIKNVIKEDANIGKRYTIDGKAIKNSHKGINIIQMKNGTTKKILIK